MPNMAMDRPKVMQAKKRAAQDRVLALLAQGHSVASAMAAVGRNYRTYQGWRDREEWFKHRADSVRGREVGTENQPFVDFRHNYFGMTTPWHQREIVDAIEAAEPRSITMILLPPGGGKTTVLEDYYNYRLGNDPNFRICVISEVQTLGRKILRRVKNRMTDPGIAGAYIDKFGPFRAEDREHSKPWGADQITLVTANSGERDYSMEVLGAGSTIYGAQYELIVLDDVQSRKKLNTTEKLVEYFRQDVYTRIIRANTRGKIVIVGTRVGPGDFYESLLSLDIPITLIKIPALLEHPDVEGTVVSYFPPQVHPTGSPIVNEKGEQLGFSLDDLAHARRVVGEETWSRVYMQEPVSKKGKTFTETMIENSKDYERIISDRGYLDPHPGVYRIASLDPSVSNWAVFTVTSFDYENLYVLDGRREEALASFDPMWDIIEELTIKWRPQTWIIEANAIQGGIARGDRIRELGIKYGFTIKAHQSGTNKMDTIIGIAGMASSFRTRNVRLPWGDENSQLLMKQLCKELDKWRPDVPAKLLQQDEVMALWFDHLEWQRLKGELASRVSSDRPIQTRGLPYQATAYPYTRGGRQPVGARR